MVDITEVIVETSLIASNIIDVPASYLEDCTEEELNEMVDIPLEGGLLDIEVEISELVEGMVHSQIIETVLPLYKPTYS